MICWEVHFVTAFLNDTLTEENHLRQQDGFIESKSEDLVCKLNRSLYGVKLSPRCLNLVYDELLEFIGFTSSSVDQSVYVHSANDVYVDDIVILSDTVQVQHRSHSDTYDSW